MKQTVLLVALLWLVADGSFNGIFSVDIRTRRLVAREMRHGEEPEKIWEKTQYHNEEAIAASARR